MLGSRKMGIVYGVYVKFKVFSVSIRPSNQRCALRNIRLGVGLHFGVFIISRSISKGKDWSPHKSSGFKTTKTIYIHARQPVAHSYLAESYHPYLLPASFLFRLPLAKCSSSASFWLLAALTSCFKLCLPEARALTGLCTACSPACRRSSLAAYS